MRTWRCIGLALLMVLGVTVATSASTLADRFTFTPHQFSVVQIRFGKNGTGEGRSSLGVPVAADNTLGVALADYDTAPALLTDVRAEQSGTH